MGDLAYDVYVLADTKLTTGQIYDNKTKLGTPAATRPTTMSEYESVYTKQYVYVTHKNAQFEPRVRTWRICFTRMRYPHNLL